MLNRFCFIVISFFVFSVSLNAQKTVLDTLVVATVNAEPITYNEYKYFLNKNRAGVIRHFRQNCGFEYDLNFWVDTCEGKSPKQYLADKSLKESIITKTQQVVAMNLGLVSDISYEQFLVGLQKENKRRLEAKKQNQVIFGPVQYSEKVYFDYLFSNLVIQIKKELAKTKFDLNDQLLQVEYDELKDSLFLQGYYTKNLIVKLKSRHKEPLTEKEEMILNEIQLKMNKGFSVKKLVESKKTNKYFDVSHQYFIVNDSVYKREEDGFILSLVKSATKSLNVGETSAMVKTQGAYFYVHIQEKKNLGYREFEKCKRVVYDSYLNKLYENYIKEWGKRADIVIYEKNIYNI